MPRSQATNQRIREGRRADVLRAARSALARKGLATTMADVAEAAGISQGLAYRYFASKDELFHTLLSEALLSEQDALSQRLSGSPGQRVAQLVSALVEGRRRNPELHQLLGHLLAAERPPNDLIELVESRKHRFQRRLRRLIVEAQAAGELAMDDPDQLVSALSACLDGLARIPAEQFPDARIVLRLLAAPAASSPSSPSSPTNGETR
ncbi:TetR/AcrR family transcriptional regulator [Flindersiella endophytica]